MDVRSQLKSFFTEHWKYLAVSAACRLNLFDILKDEPGSLQALVLNTGYSRSNLGHLLQALCSIGFLENRDGVFDLTDLSTFLTEDQPGSLKYASMNWSSEHLIAWQNLDYTVRTGESSFEYVFGQPYFEYLARHPEKEKSYQRAMQEYAFDDYALLPTCVDFGIHKKLIDVGGGTGVALGFIKDHFPHVECILVDLEGVVEHCSHPGLHLFPGDFFTSIPKGADGLLLSRVLHDWEDEKALLILRNSWDAISSGSVLYIIENCGVVEQMDLSLLSLNMAVMCQSMERTLAEYLELCAKVGFEFQRSVKLNALQTIFIFVKP
jgi:hypothetical protein